MTPLNAADGQIYAVAQGTVIAGGAAAEGDAARVVQGVPTSGMIPAGARIEREVDFDFSELSSLRLALREPDFTTAALQTLRCGRPCRASASCWCATPRTRSTPRR